MKPPLAAALLAIALGLAASSLAARPPPASRLADFSTEALIGRFQQESEQTIGANTSVTMEGFIGVEAPLKFGGGLLGVPLPKVSPVMRELVRRGVSAVPALLDHLTDARPTKLLIKQKRAFGSTQFFDAEYDPRDFAANELPTGVHRINAEIEHEEPFQEYRIRVGDLCYATLGQIVNRRLNAVRYQPSGMFYVNSPVHTLALAAAARVDRGGLTATEFTAYLMRDLERNEDDWNSMSVLRRLLFYDPPAGVAQAIKLLAQGIYDPTPIVDLTTKLWATADEQEREKLLDDFWSTQDESARHAVEQAVMAASTPLTPEDIEVYPEGGAMQKRAVELAARRFPGGNKTPGSSQLWLPCREQCEVVETIAAERSAEIDTAVRDLFHRTLALRADNGEDTLSRCRLAMECAQRFVPARRWREIARAYGKLRRDDLRAMQVLLSTLAAEPAFRPPAAPR